MKSKPPVLRGLYSRLKYEFRATKELYAMCAAVDKYPLVTLLATADTLATHLIEGRR